MTINIPSHFVSQFSTNVDLLLQDKAGKLRSLVSTGTHVGKQASPVDQIGSVEAQQPAGRFAPIGRVDADVARRWVFPTDRDLPQLFDNFDKLRLITDPKSKYVENAGYAFARFFDDLVIDAAFATAYIGETGTGTEAFDTSNYSVAADFDSASEVGLTVSKLIEVQRKFQAANVDLDMDPATVVIGPTQHADLLKQAQVTSSDFNKNGGVLNSGRVSHFMGFNIVVSNRLDLVNTDDRACIAFVKSGLYLGTWQETVHSIDVRADLSSRPWQLYSMATAGATRLEQGKVIRVLCDE